MTASRILTLTLLTLALAAMGPAAIARGEALALSGGDWQALPTNDDSPAAAVLEIRRLLAEDAPEAAKAATTLAEKTLSDYEFIASDELTERVMSLHVEALLKQERFWAAYEAVEEQLARFPAGELVNRALGHKLDVAAAYLAGEKKFFIGFIPYTIRDQALEMLQQVRDRAGASPITVRSILMEATYYASRNDWVGAYDAYMLLRKTTADPQTRMSATLDAADAIYNSFEGAEWDDTPLIEAEQLYKSFLAARDEGPEALHAADRLVAIEYLRAEKDYRTARYYRRTDRPDAARFYYGQVIQRYPGLEWARLAKEEIASLRGN